MRTVREGDYYHPENNEVVNIEYRGDTHVCICITENSSNPKYLGEHILGLCDGCPLDQSCCKRWLYFDVPHCVIPVEDIVE